LNINTPPIIATKKNDFRIIIEEEEVEFICQKEKLFSLEVRDRVSFIQRLLVCLISIYDREKFFFS
jgi:uncharacterized pyridoxamine 5'-phosphate oxidase family protein